jgi:DNA-binding NarL/FixJ family response regulator
MGCPYPECELAIRLAALLWLPHVVLTSADPESVAVEDVLRTGVAGFVPKQDLSEGPLERLFMARPG